MSEPTHHTEQYWKYARNRQAERWRNLFHAACGYISTSPEWSNQHPEAVANYFETELHDA